MGMFDSVDWKSLSISLSSLFIFVLVDYFSCGHSLFSIPKLDCPKLTAFSSTVFLLTTFVSQIILPIFSSIQTGIAASVIFEAAIFTRAISKTCYETLTENNTKLNDSSLVLNIFICVALSTIMFSALSLLPWLWNLGNFFRNLPLQPIFGAMSAIGLEILKDALRDFAIFKTIPSVLLFSLIIFTGFAMLLLELFFPDFPFIIHCFSGAIVILFSLVSYGFLKKSSHELQQLGHILPGSGDDQFSIFSFISLFENSRVSFKCISSNISNIFSLLAFNMIHLNVNLSTYAMATDSLIDYNREWLAQSLSNLATSLLGYPSYFVGVTSVLFYRSGANSKLASIFGSVVVLLIAFIAPYIRNYIPNLLSAIILTYVGFSFLLCYFLKIWLITSFNDFIIIFITLVVSLFIGIAQGFFIGCIISILIAMNYLPVRFGKSTDIHSGAVDGSDNQVIRISCILCFSTLSQLKKYVELAGDEFTLDLTECPYIDMNVNMYLRELAESNKRICIIGKPDNLYIQSLAEFSNIHILDKTY